MKSALRCLTVAAVLVVSAPAPATAHVPDRYVKLYHEAGNLSDAVTRKENEANEAIEIGLDKGRYVTQYDFSLTANRWAQLLGWLGDCSHKMAAAIKCTREG